MTSPTDNDEDWIMFKHPCEGQGEARFVGFEDLVDGGGSRPQRKGCNKVDFVRTVAGEDGTVVILDSRADISVLPMSYREVGFPLDRVTSLRDAQGGKMTNGGMRQAIIELENEEGHLVELRESFALSNVKEPLLALGKLLRRGWKIEGESGDVRLTHGLFSKSLQFRHNSLAVDAKIRKVGTIMDQPVEESKVRAVTMEFQFLLKSLLGVAGWHLTSDRRVPFLVTLSTKFYKDSFPQFNRVDFPYRSTVIWKSGNWSKWPSRSRTKMRLRSVKVKK